MTKIVRLGLNRFVNVLVERHAERISNVQSRLLPSKQGAGLGYLRISEFSERTREEVEEAIATMRRQVFERDTYGTDTKDTSARPRGGRTAAAPLQGLVIDVRGNPGGPIGSAFDVASLFLGSGTILSRTCTHREKENGLDKDPGSLRAANSRELKKLLRRCEVHRSLNTRPNKDTSLLLVMDGYTASASEIMIAALTANKRAVSLGTPTKGKNVAQALVQMSDGSGLAFTIREYLDPRAALWGMDAFLIYPCMN